MQKAKVLIMEIQKMYNSQCHKTMQCVCVVYVITAKRALQNKIEEILRGHKIAVL